MKNDVDRFAPIRGRRIQDLPFLAWTNTKSLFVIAVRNNGDIPSPVVYSSASDIQRLIPDLRTFHPRERTKVSERVNDNVPTSFRDHVLYGCLPLSILITINLDLIGDRTGVGSVCIVLRSSLSEKIDCFSREDRIEKDFLNEKKNSTSNLSELLQETRI